MYPQSFSPHGERLAYAEFVESGGDLYTVGIENDVAGLRARQPEPFVKTSADERHRSFSPDGRWIAFVSNKSGTEQIYVRSYPDNGGEWLVSSAGGIDPDWSRNGRELFFRSLDNQVMVENYTATSDAFSPGRQPRLWSPTGFRAQRRTLTTICTQTANALWP